MTEQHHLEDDLLQRHFDGDLDSAELAEVRAHLADCAECNAQLESLGRLQRLIRSALKDEAEAGGDVSDATWQGMFARIEQAAQEPERAPVAPVLRPTTAARAKWFRPAVMSAAGAIAVAAAVLLTIARGPDANPMDETYDDESDGTLARLEVSHSEITHVDFGANYGAVFDIAYDDGSSTPVVWISDDDDDAEE